MLIPMKTRLLFLSLTCILFNSLDAAPPTVTNVFASQRTGTKYVDINYTLTLDFNQTAFVELWFSPDNGLTYPVRCLDVSGDVDQNVSGGQKLATWNAESDWNQKFTNSGKIRVIATYGDQPSGFAGSGGSHGGGGQPGNHDPNMKQVPLTLYLWDDDGTGTSAWMQRSNYYEFVDSNAIGMKIDPVEVTNGLWDDVVQWANGNGYSGLTLKGGDPVAPATNVTYWQAIKWCNARSEKDGLVPAYYTDLSEGSDDLNQNGIVDTGPDTWSAYDPGDDPNQDGFWDPGEPFNDVNGDGNFTPAEYLDYNGNGQYDPGLTQVFRQGSVIPLPNNAGSGVMVKLGVNGYRLPHELVYYTAVTGGNFSKKWPWGDQDFPGSGNGNDYDDGNFSQKYRVSIPGGTQYAEPTKASDRQPNGFDLFDVLGNLAELTEMVQTMDDGQGNVTEEAKVFGGSYLGLDNVGNANFKNMQTDAGQPISLFSDVTNFGPSAETSPAIGFRCVVFLH